VKVGPVLLWLPRDARFRGSLCLSGWPADPPVGHVAGRQQHRKPSGKGLLLPIDAHYKTLYRVDGVRWRNRIQTYDSTFTLAPTDGIPNIHQAGVLRPSPACRRNRCSMIASCTMIHEPAGQCDASQHRHTDSHHLVRRSGQLYADRGASCQVGRSRHPLSDSGQLHKFFLQRDPWVVQGSVHCSPISLCRGARSETKAYWVVSPGGPPRYPPAPSLGLVGVVDAYDGDGQQDHNRGHHPEPLHGGERLEQDSRQGRARHVRDARQRSGPAHAGAAALGWEKSRAQRR